MNARVKMEPITTTNATQQSSPLTGNKIGRDCVQRQEKRKPTKKNRLFLLGQNVPSRLVLYFLSWSGFLVSFMMRNDMNFAIVEMTVDEQQEEQLHQQRQVQHVHVYNNCTLPPAAQSLRHMDVSNTYDANETTTTTSPSSPSLFRQFGNASLNQSGSGELSASVPPNSNHSNWIDKDDNDEEEDDDCRRSLRKATENGERRYNWSVTSKNLITSSFYWSYVLSQVVGGIATQRYGTKHVFGWSQFATAACSLCIPLCADLHYVAVILLRSVQGFASGLTWPAMYAIVGHWIPLTERSRFMSSFQGFSIGIGLTYALCGFIIQYSWRYIFFMTGTLGMLWCLAWYFLAFNTPREHPRISAQELDYIERSVAADVSSTHSHNVPWRQIITSKATWAIAIATFGRIWIHYIFIIFGPNFMKNMLQFDYAANGFLSGMPFICSYISSVGFCYVADQIIVKKLLSLTNVRKVFTALSQIVPGILIYLIGYMDKNIVMRLVLWFIAVTYITASYAGAMANIVDIAPNLAGPVLAFCQTIHMSASFLSPLISGQLLSNEHSIEQWRIVFGVAAFVSISTYLFYQFMGTAKIQPWNYPSTLLLVSTDGCDSNGNGDGDGNEKVRSVLEHMERTNSYIDDNANGNSECTVPLNRENGIVA